MRIGLEEKDGRKEGKVQEGH